MQLFSHTSPLSGCQKHPMSLTSQVLKIKNSSNQKQLSSTVTLILSPSACIEKDNQAVLLAWLLLTSSQRSTWSFIFAGDKNKSVKKALIFVVDFNYPSITVTLRDIQKNFDYEIFLYFTSQSSGTILWGNGITQNHPPPKEVTIQICLNWSPDKMQIVYFFYCNLFF